MNIKLLHSDSLVTTPAYGDAGIDLHIYSDATTLLYNGEQRLFGTGIAAAIPTGWVGFVTPRSGLGTKGLVLGNAIGVIDASYRGEIMLALLNRNTEGKPIKIEPGMKVAQMVVVPCWSGVIHIVDELDETERGVNGFGSTGV